VQGVIDTRGAMTFEKKLVELVDANTRRIVIDFKKVDLITSAGIRVLVMMGKRLRGDGSLVLTGLTDQVRSVFDIAGLTNYFVSTPSVADAVSKINAEQASRARIPAGPSKISRLLMRLLGDSADAPAPAAPQSGPPSQLASTVTSLLEQAHVHAQKDVTVRPAGGTPKASV
jgi:anti-anti-sigma factor